MLVMAFTSQQRNGNFMISLNVEYEVYLQLTQLIIDFNSRINLIFIGAFYSKTF